MLLALLPLMFQAASGEPAKPVDAKPAEAKPVCKYVNVTGSRVIKELRCKTPETDKKSENVRDEYKQSLMQNGSGQQPPPP